MLAFNHIPPEFATWELLVMRKGDIGFVRMGEYFGDEMREVINLELEQDPEVISHYWMEIDPAIVRWIQYVLMNGHWVNDYQTFVLKEPGDYFARVLLTQAQATEAARAFYMYDLKGVNLCQSGSPKHP